MLYEVTGILQVDLNCDCPDCGGDAHYDEEEVTRQVNADSPEEAKLKAIRLIRDDMEHDCAIVKWQNEAGVTVTPDEPPGTDQILMKLGATPLFPLEGFMK